MVAKFTISVKGLGYSEPFIVMRKF